MTEASSGERPAKPGRALSWKGFIAVAIVYLAIIQIGGRLLLPDVDAGDKYLTAHNFLLGVLLPVGISALFAAAVATWLGWWRPILSEPLRVQRWVWAIPIVLIAAAVIGTSWGNLFDLPIELVLYLVLLVCFVGFAEELMFRGLGLVAFRRDGFSEARVALFTSLLFGAAHLSNAFGAGPSAIFQAIIVSGSGYFFYLTRRVGGTILLAMVVHGSQDFVMLSGQVGVDPKMSPAAMLVVLAMIGLAITVWVRRHKIELPPA